MRCPAFVYVGSEDERAFKPLQEWRKDIETAGLTLRVFEHLDHEQEIRAIETVFPPVFAFLAHGRIE
ncbi:MAG: hypothetical protein NVS9B9_12900 [Ktedonobacteraceae bacterium]